MLAAIYTRVSTDEQARDGVSLGMQERLCRAAAEEDGADEIRLYRDDGYTGTNVNRPALQQLLGDIPDLDVVYLWRLDRLSRSLRDTLELFSTFGEADVGIKSATEHHDYSSPTGKLFLRMQGAIAEFYGDQLREAVVTALRYRVESGLHHSRPPYGYHLVAPDVPMEPDPDQAPVVRRLYDAYARGASLIGLAQRLNAEGAPTGHGAATWATSTIKRILSNPTYLGQVISGDEVFEGLHEPLVSARLWRSVQRRRRAHADLHPRTRTASLAPLLRCGVCGGLMTRKGSHGAQSHEHRYVCDARRMQPAGSRHEPVSVLGLALEVLIWAYAGEVLGDSALRSAAQRADEGKRDAALEERLAEVALTIERNLDAYHAAAVPLELLVERNEPLMLERAALRSRLGSGPDDVAGPGLVERRWLAEVDEAGLARLRAAPLGRQREFLGRLFERIEVGRCAGEGPGRGVATFVHRWDGGVVTYDVPCPWRLGDEISLPLTPSKGAC